MTTQATKGWKMRRSREKNPPLPATWRGDADVATRRGVDVVVR